jgi:uncharacterized protein (DUF427 family)
VAEAAIEEIVMVVLELIKKSNGGTRCPYKALMSYNFYSSTTKS